jgi:flagellar hook assembly protein FlgD
VYTLAAPADVSVRIVSLGGRLVATLDAGPKAAGSHTASWDGLDSTGRRAASGVYACEVEAAGARRRTAVVLLR